MAEDERERVRRVGLRVVASESGLGMPQPCSALRGSLCAVYEHRPEACRRYECSLRERLVAGTTTKEAGAASVQRMRALLVTIRAAVGRPDASMWDAILAVAEPGEAMSADRLDVGLRALSELLELARAVFEPRFTGGAATRGRDATTEA